MKKELPDPEDWRKIVSRKLLSPHLGPHSRRGLEIQNNLKFQGRKSLQLVPNVDCNAKLEGKVSAPEAVVLNSDGNLIETNHRSPHINSAT